MMMPKQQQRSSTNRKKSLTDSHKRVIKLFVSFLLFQYNKSAYVQLINIYTNNTRFFFIVDHKEELESEHMITLISVCWELD